MTRTAGAPKAAGTTGRARPRKPPAEAKVTSAGEPQPDALRRYREKRDFTRTPEPAGDGPHGTPAHGKTGTRTGKQEDDAAKAALGQADGPAPTAAAPLRFVIQKHWARRLHYDLRLEIGGTMKSWAVPKGPSLDPTIKRMAVQVEDHPIAYNDFEGTIPGGQYGAGKVIIWDRGHWKAEGDPAEAYRAGKLKFELAGRKLQGRWTLVRMGGGDGEKNGWLLIKEKDGAATARRRTMKAAAMPETLSPQLATRVSAPPATGDWIYELKYDGYRILTRMSGGRARFHTRRGHDWTNLLPALARAFESRPLPDGWYDGEIVVLDSRGRPDFQALQNAFEREGGQPPSTATGKRGGRGAAAREPVVYFLFDLPWLEDQDLRRLPLAERRARLAGILEGVSHPGLRLSAAFETSARDMLKSACELGLEGVIGKRRASPYVSGRGGQWIKLKCGERQEFVIGGYTDPKGGRTGLGALLLGYYDDEGDLRYAGNVGSGFSEASLTALHRRLRRMHQEQPSFVDPPRAAGPHWVRPILAAEVSFSQWTDSGRVRHAVFQGLRTDKPTSLMKKEHSRSITNAGRAVDKRSGARKGDVATYYERIAPLILPHLKDRPVSLLRAPEGLSGELFFQKHMAVKGLTGLMQLDPGLDPGHDPLVVVRNAGGLAEAAQLNVIEFHTWNAVRSRIQRPDRISFDLDPGRGVEWPAMQEAAILLRNFLTELGLPSFVKTSGGKGLHVIVPIMRRYDWETARGFSRAVVQHMAEVLPRRFSAKSGPRNRIGKIFIDYLRNGFGATTVAAWSLRARPGMGVSVPIGWDEVETLASSDQWTISNIDERLETGNRPWDAYAASASALGPAMKRLGYPERPSRRAPSRKRAS
ncbi:DNA ligase D [Alcaligenaceae bacterium]|nr:DNA ligase D [Alcaligenaceae bacterium]